VVDDDYLYRAFGGDESEAELLLDGGEHGWVGFYCGVDGGGLLGA
jgi:hypothetical protein